MEQFIALTVSGVVAGAIYSLLGAGLVMTYSTTGVFNFAHGAIAFVTAFVYYQLHSGLDIAVAPAAIFSVFVFAPLLGLLLNRLIFLPMADADPVPKIVATIGLLVALPALTLWITDILINTVGISLAPTLNVVQPAGIGPVPPETWSITDILQVNSDQVIVLITAAVAALGLAVLLRRTSLGLRMRAAVERRPLAAARGVNTRHMASLTWGLGCLLAGAAGVVGAPLFSLVPATYTSLLFIAATAAVLGQLKSIPITFLAGLGIGVTQAWVAGYVSFADTVTGFTTSVPFILMIVGLLVLGKAKGRVASQPAESIIPVDYLRALPLWRRALPWAIAVAALCIYSAAFADNYRLGLIAKGLGFSLIFLSFVVVTGLGGMVSLSQATFVSMAGLVTGMLVSHDWPLVLAMVVGIASATLAGMIVALPALRLGGVPLALATLALATLCYNLLFAWEALGNGQAGWRIRRPSLGPIDLKDNRTLVFFALGVLGIVLVGVCNFWRSPSGRAVLAVRSAPPAAAAVGVWSVRAKLKVFALSATIAGLGGVMLATIGGNVSRATFPPEAGLLWLAVIVLFGVRRPAAALVAGMVFALSPEVVGWFTTSAYVPAILFGLGGIQLATAPDGVVTMMGGLRHHRARARLAAEPTPVDLDHPDEQVVADIETTGLDPALLHRSNGTSAPESAESPVLELDGLSSGYGPVPVLRRVSISVPAGAMVALLGPNGAGKSTLCQAAIGLLPATAGSVRLDGDDVTSLRPDERARRGLLYIPESRGIFPGLSVEDNLAIGLPRREDREQVYESTPLLHQRRKLSAGTLSGGEQQILSLAPLAVRPPRVLVVDEPSLGLAPMVVERVMRLLDDLRRQGVAILIVEEKATHVLEYTQQVTLLDRGQTIWSGSADGDSYETIASRYLHAGASTT